MTEPSQPKPRRGLASRVVGSVVQPFVAPVVDVLDVDSVLERVDVDELMERVDVNRLLDRIDVNRLLDRVDVTALLARVEPEAIAELMSAPALREQTQLIIAQSTSGVASRLLDVLRSQAVTLDLVVHGWVGRVLRRTSADARRPGRPGVAPAEVLAEVLAEVPA